MLLALLSPARATELRVMTLGDSIVGGGEGNFRTPLKKLLEADGYAVRYVGILRDADGNPHEGHGGWTPAQVRLVLGSRGVCRVRGAERAERAERAEWAERGQPRAGA
jgi:hypothetical protein